MLVTQTLASLTTPASCGVQKKVICGSSCNTEDHEQSGREVSLQASLDATGSISLPRVWSVDKIPVSEESFPVPDDVKRWSHLRDIDLPHNDGRKVMF